ncbi:DNA cytosine methyltransferase [Jiangella gansuensis]|uniref:DNA cytosine methyltransferase n=1 Tax=Jiangella gansuensis TaxID=281473 RepID=UPI0004793E22|nr:DNA (cytosine-5-)-methyltransferase [Jiangella gansuensis]
MSLTVLSLFSGIGGLELGLEWAGMTTVGQVEIDPYCQRVLARHWPEVPRHDDVRTAPEWWLGAPRPVVDVVAGGYPCQPFSDAGRRRGVADERWGWPWFEAVVRAVRPRYVVVENVPALADDTEAFGWMLGDLAALGFDAEWDVLSACAVGAPHTRERLFLVAYADSLHGSAGMGGGQEQQLARLAGWTSAGIRGGSQAGAWGDRVDWAVETAGLDDRNANGTTARMAVTAGGNAVVPQVAELIGRLITAHDEEMAA